MLIQDPGLVQDCVAKVRSYCSDLETQRPKVVKGVKQVVSPPLPPTTAPAFCIGSSDALPFDPRSQCAFLLSLIEEGRGSAGAAATRMPPLRQAWARNTQSPHLPRVLEVPAKDVQARITVGLA